MSYARFGMYSDVHVLDVANEGFACLNCKAKPPEFRCKTAKEMAAHLREHQTRGDKVPAAAIAELDERGSWK